MEIIKKIKVYEFKDLSDSAKYRARMWLCDDDSFRWHFEDLEEWALNLSEFKHVNKYSVYSWDLNPCDVSLGDDLDLDIEGIINEFASEKVKKYFARWPWLSDYIAQNNPSIYWRNSRSPIYEIDMRHTRADRKTRTIKVVNEAIECLNSYISDMESAIIKSLQAQYDYFYSDERCREESEVMEVVFDENGRHYYIDDADIELINEESE